MLYNVKMVIAVRTDLNMRKGKAAAQVGHAASQFLLEKYNHSDTLECLHIVLTQAEAEWFHGGHAKIVVGISSEQELLDLIQTAKDQYITVNPVIDAGNTEFHGKATLTCAAFGPEYSEKLNLLTGHLKLI